jgi:hypothetical protein
VADNIAPYLAGSAFSEQLRVPVSRQRTMFNRVDFILGLARGRNVIHVGCVDHLPYLADKISSDTWFHGRLTQATANCIGVDVNRTGVELLRSTYRIDNVHCVDLTRDPNFAAVKSRRWDWLVLGEVLEHVDNPVQFIADHLTNYGANIAGVIISVPNALRAGNMLRIFRNHELINSDHRYWFTPYTLQKVAYSAGLIQTHAHLCHYTQRSGIQLRLRNFLLGRYPLLAENIVLVGETGAGQS